MKTIYFLLILISHFSFNILFAQSFPFQCGRYTLTTGMMQSGAEPVPSTGYVPESGCSCISINPYDPLGSGYGGLGDYTVTSGMTVNSIECDFCIGWQNLLNNDTSHLNPCFGHGQISFITNQSFSFSGYWTRMDTISNSSDPYGDYDYFRFIDLVYVLKDTFPSPIIISNEILNNTTFSIHKILWSGNSNKEAPSIKICTDGTAATKITYINYNPNININNIQFIISSDPNGGNKDFSGYIKSTVIKGDTITAVLNHPNYLPASYTCYRQDAILIVYNDSCNPNYKIPIDIYRAPVLMVHGLFSNEGSFIEMENSLIGSNLYPHELIKRMDYSGLTTHSFDNNADLIPQNINSLLTQCRSNNFSTGKVDVIGHSMGGILARYYLQSDAYQQKQDIHKLITINTPHSGSPFASLLSNKTNPVTLAARIVAESVIKIKYFPLHVSITDGAIDDLAINSIAMNYLNVEKLNNGKAPTHAIITQSSLKDDGIYYPIYYAGSPPIFMDPSAFIDFLFYNDPNDMIVSASSQSGGLPTSNVTTILNQIHSGSTDNTAVINEVKTALNETPSNAGYFCQTGFNPVPQLSHYKMFPDTASHLLSGSIKINYPVQNQYFNPGDVIPLSINSANEISRIILEAVYSQPNSYILDTAMGNGIINYTVPDDAVGPLEFIALGYDPNNLIDFDTVTIYINQMALLDSISLYGDTLYIQKNKTFSVSVNAYFNNGNSYNVSLSPDVQYLIADTNYAKYRNMNLIQGKNIGRTTLSVSYLEQTKDIPVVVIPEDTSSVNIITSLNDNLDHGFNIQDKEIKNINIFPNPFNNTATIQYQLTENKNISIKVFDIYGKVASELLNVIQTKGNHTIIIDGSTLSNGVYMVELKTENQIVSKKLLLIK